jgi:uracil-DNA glycosylase
MSDLLSANLNEKIKQRLSFYEDLGIAPFYRERSSGARHTVDPSPPSSVLAAPISEEETLPKPVPSIATAKTTAPSQSFVGAQHAAPQLARTSTSSGTPSLPLIKTSSFFEQLERVENDTLLRIREDIGDCTRCRLHKKRNHIVFADGNPKAELVFVGEGPGADEDATGIPFVGRAGKLLTQMIQAMGLQREDVYICNVVKCRPPENRQPEPDEVTTCSPYLVRQLEVVNPKVIVCLGATAAQTLLETTTGISKFRGQWQDFRGKKLLATYHPAYLLRNPAAKSEVWKDLQKVMGELGLEVKKSKPV